jgi:hypothetical protein
MGYRTGDNAPLSSIEFIDTVKKKKPKKKAPAAS